MRKPSLRSTRSILPLDSRDFSSSPEPFIAIGDRAAGGLSEQHSARAFKLAHDFCVIVRNAVAIRFRTPCRRDAFRIGEIFQRIGNAVQGSAIASLGKLLIRLRRLLARAIGRHRHKGRQPRIEFFNALQIEFSQLNR